MSYTVFRSDLLHGTDSGVDLVSVRVYDASGTPIAVENGAIVELKEYEAGEREVWKGVLATASSKLSDCVVIGSEELFYDERRKNLDEFINEAGSICRGYILRSRNMFGITKDGFVGGTVPASGAAVRLGAGGKIAASSTTGTVLGKIQAIEAAGRYTYYVIRITNAEV